MCLCVYVFPLSAKRQNWCTVLLTSRWVTKNSRRRWGNWSRLWRQWRTATRSWLRRMRICATRPGCKIHFHAPTLQIYCTTRWFVDFHQCSSSFTATSSWPRRRGCWRKRWRRWRLLLAVQRKAELVPPHTANMWSVKLRQHIDVLYKYAFCSHAKRWYVSIVLLQGVYLYSNFRQMQLKFKQDIIAPIRPHLD